MGKKSRKQSSGATLKNKISFNQLNQKVTETNKYKVQKNISNITLYG